MKKILHLADLFCGAGGTSTGAVEAGEKLGYKVDLTAINHWPVAIATHTVNHPHARHLCTSIDDVNPRTLYAEGELDVLWASPECTHHSVARGGKPINDQSRATAWCVVRWAEALRPNVILVENVPEFLTWGPIDTKGRPMKSRKGEVFHAWVATLQALGYRVGWKVLCAADYGDPTTRRRLFVMAVRGKRRVVWPDATHAPIADVDLFGGTRKRWVAAREIIDWQLPAQSIYERKKPLSPKTINRIFEGLRKFGLKPSVVAWDHQSGTGLWSQEEPLSTVTAKARHGLTEPFLVRYQGDHVGRDESARCAQSLDEPVTTVTVENRFGLAQPFIIGAGGSEYAAKPQSVDAPVTTVTTENHRALVQPFIMSAGGPECPPRSTEEPVGTVLTRDHRALVDPFLVELRGTSKEQINGSAKSLDEPVSTVSTSGAHHSLIEPYLVQVAHEGEGDSRTRSTDVPLPTVCGNRGEWALCSPTTSASAKLETRNPKPETSALLPQHGGGVLRPITEPVPTVTTDGAVALVEPYLIEYYGTGGAEDINVPLNTVTAKERHALVEPTVGARPVRPAAACPQSASSALVRPVVVINGQQYLLDIRFRMLQPHELAAAQGFRADHKFTGNKSDQVKQIGNAVPRRLARALVFAALTQNPDVSSLMDPVAYSASPS